MTQGSRGGSQAFDVALAELAWRVPDSLLCAAADIAARNEGPLGRDAVLRVFPVGSARGLALQMIEAWEGRASGHEGPELAAALRAAAAVAEHARRSRDVELVWTGPRSDAGSFRRTEQALREVIGAAERTLWFLAFAGYRLPGIVEALEGARARGVEIRVVMETPESSQERVRFSLLAGLGDDLARHCSLWVWPLAKREKDEKGRHGTLHAKAALADDKLLFVTSANLTEYAMDLNMELGVLVRGGTEPGIMARHLAELVARGFLVPHQPRR